MRAFGPGAHELSLRLERLSTGEDIFFPRRNSCGGRVIEFGKSFARRSSSNEPFPLPRPEKLVNIFVFSFMFLKKEVGSCLSLYARTRFVLVLFVPLMGLAARKWS